MTESASLKKTRLSIVSVAEPYPYPRTKKVQTITE